jgi:hypothetical protein
MAVKGFLPVDMYEKILMSVAFQQRGQKGLTAGQSVSS